MPACQRLPLDAKEEEKYCLSAVYGALLLTQKERKETDVQLAVAHNTSSSRTFHVSPSHGTLREERLHPSPGTFSETC